MVHRDIMDKLHNHDRLSDARAAEKSGLAALRIGFEQVNNFNARFEHFGTGRKIFELRRIAMNRPQKFGLNLLAAIDRLADDINEPPQRIRADGHRDRRAGIDGLHAAHEAVGRIHRNGADAVLAKMLLHFADQVVIFSFEILARNSERIQNRQAVCLPKNLHQRPAQ